MTASPATTCADEVAPPRLGAAAFALVLALALGVRALHLHDLAQRWPLYGVAYSDSLFYRGIGRELARGDWIGSFNVYLQAPGYGYALGAGLALRDRVPTALAPDEWTWLIGGQLGVAALGCALLASAATRLFHARAVGILAGCGSALYGPLVVHDAEMLPVSLLVASVATLLFLAAPLTDARPLARAPLGRACAIGLVGGCAAITWMNAAPVGAGLVVWVAWRTRRRDRASALAVLAVGGAMLATPLVLVAARNHAVSGRPAIVLGGWFNLWLANNPDWTRTAEMRATDADYTRIITAPGVHSDIEPFAWSDWYGVEARRWIAENPGAFVAGLAAKACQQLSGHERRRNVDVYVLAGASRVARPLAWHVPWVLAFPFALVLPLAVVGLAVERARWRALAPYLGFLALYAASIGPFIPAARYRLPLAVGLLPAAARGLLELGRRRSWRWTAGVACGAWVASLDLPPRPVAFDAEIAQRVGDAMSARGEGARDQGRLGEARAAFDLAARHYERAISLEPSNPSAHQRLAQLAWERDELELAETLFERASALGPHDWVPAFGCGRLAFERRDYAKAWDFARAACARRPDLSFLHVFAARCALRCGDVEAAHRSAIEALRREPANVEAQQLLRETWR